MRFDGQTITVTGATKGIGRDTAMYFSGLGAKVLATGRTMEELESLRAETGCEIFQMDMRDPDETRRIAETMPTADHLFNNAGMIVMQDFMDITLGDYQDQMNVNVLATIIMSQVFISKLQAEGRTGSIVNMSSVSSTTGFLQHGTYCASKGAVDSLTTVMARELGPLGFRVNAVNPALTLTPLGMQAWSDEKKAAGLKARIPMGRFLEPVEISQVVAFLMSDEASMVHGAMVPVDGGFLCT